MNHLIQSSVHTDPLNETMTCRKRPSTSPPLEPTARRCHMRFFESQRKYLGIMVGAKAHADGIKAPLAKYVKTAAR